MGIEPTSVAWEAHKEILSNQQHYTDFGSAIGEPSASIFAGFFALFQQLRSAFGYRMRGR